jgi:hypothetical protein
LRLGFRFERYAFSLGVQTLVDAVPVEVFLNVVVAFGTVTAEFGYATVPVDLAFICTVDAADQLFFTFT